MFSTAKKMENPLFSTRWKEAQRSRKQVFFTDEYMISIVSPEEIGTLHNILSPEEFSKVKKLTGRR